MSAPTHSRPVSTSDDPERFKKLETEYRPLLVFGWAAVVGTLAGLVGAIFRILVEGSGRERTALFDHMASLGLTSVAIPIVCTSLVVAASLFLVRRFAPETSGSGVQEIEGALDDVRPLRWRRVIPVKFFAGLLSLGAGMVLGREGPTIQLGGNFGKMITDGFELPPGVQRTLVAAGAGAGLSAAFNAPLAGVLFVMEEMRPEFEYTFTSVQSVVIACAVADIVVRLLTGQGPAISIVTFNSPPLASLWLFPIFGAVFGLLGILFNRLLVRTLDFFSDLKGWSYHATGLFVGILIGFLAWVYPHSVGGGDSLIPQILRTPTPVAALLLLFMVRFGTTMISYGCGAPGGIFAPMLALGTLFGMWYGHFAHLWFPEQIGHPGIFAVAGMGALFTATVRAPVTGIALAIELTANYEQILPLLLTCAPATIVAELLGSQPIYTVLLKRTLDRAKVHAAVN
jgi:chloride channel protein, CIC family